MLSLSFLTWRVGAVLSHVRTESRARWGLALGLLRPSGRDLRSPLGTWDGLKGSRQAPGLTRLKGGVGKARQERKERGAEGTRYQEPFGEEKRAQETLFLLLRLVEGHASRPHRAPLPPAGERHRCLRTGGAPPKGGAQLGRDRRLWVIVTAPASRARPPSVPSPCAESLPLRWE